MSILLGQRLEVMGADTMSAMIIRLQLTFAVCCGMTWICGGGWAAQALEADSCDSR